MEDKEPKVLRIEPTKTVYCEQTRTVGRYMTVRVPEWVDVDELDPKTIRDILDAYGDDEWYETGDWEATAEGVEDEPGVVVSWPFDTEHGRQVFGRVDLPERRRVQGGNAT